MCLSSNVCEIYTWVTMVHCMLRWLLIYILGFYFIQKWKKIKRKKNAVHQFREFHWNKWIITKRVASINVLWIHSKALLCVKCLKPDFVIKLIKRKYSFVENVWPIYDYQRTQQGKIFWTMNEVLFLLRKILNLCYI